MTADSAAENGPVLVVSAHAGDFVWRAGGAIALAASQGAEVTVLCLSYGERGESAELVDEIVRCYRRAEPAVVLTHALADPYNPDHPAAARMALQARVLAQAIGYDAPGEPLGAPPVFLFEPHQPEQCDFKPQVLLDITEVFNVKRRAMECLVAQQHMWDYYTDLARRRGVQLRRNAGPNLGLAHDTMAEAYMRVYPQVTGTLR